MSKEFSLNEHHVFARPWGDFAYADSSADTIQTGANPVLLIHGTGRERRDWAGLLPWLGGRRLIVPDLRGHGNSTRPQEPFTFASLAEDLRALIANVGCGGVDIVGHSLGGMLALEVLRRAPESCGRLVLLEGWSRLTVMRRLERTVASGLSREQVAGIDAMNHDTFMDWGVGVRKSFWQTVEAFDGVPILAASEHAILELYGDRGRAVDDLPTAADLRVPTKPNIVFGWLSGCAHFMLMQDPAQVGVRVQEFLPVVRDA